MRGAAWPITRAACSPASRQIPSTTPGQRHGLTRRRRSIADASPTPARPATSRVVRARRHRRAASVPVRVSRGGARRRDPAPPRRGRRLGACFGLLRDQALGIESTLMEYRLTGDPALLEWAQRAAEWSVRHLWDDEAGAFRMAPAGADGTPDLAPVFPLLANGEMAIGPRLRWTAHARTRGISPLCRDAPSSPRPAGARLAARTGGRAGRAGPSGQAGRGRDGRRSRRSPGPRPGAGCGRRDGAGDGDQMEGRGRGEHHALRRGSLPACRSRSPRDLLHALVDAGLAPGVILDPRSRADRTVVPGGILDGRALPSSWGWSLLAASVASATSVWVRRGPADAAVEGQCRRDAAARDRPTQQLHERAGRAAEARAGPDPCEASGGGAHRGTGSVRRTRRPHQLRLRLHHPTGRLPRHQRARCQRRRAHPGQARRQPPLRRRA